MITARKFAKVMVGTTVVVVAASMMMGLGISAALAQQHQGSQGSSRQVPASLQERLHLQKIEEIRARSAQGFALSVALAIGLACLGAGYAVGRVGSAAVGAISEQPELFGRVLLFVALAEGIAIYGILAGILLFAKII